MVTTNTTSFSSSSMSRRQENGGPGSASTATAELDTLMTSLNNFKMDGRNVDEPVIGGAPNLDMMLGDLQVIVLSSDWSTARLT